jgi:hypothetical protein
MYGVVFARNVRRTANSKDYLTPEEIDSIFKERISQIISERSVAPDLIVLGASNIVTPSIFSGGEPYFNLFMSQDSNYGTKIVSDKAYGIGFTCLQFALDWIRLGKLPWDKILSNALNIRRVE